MYIIRTESAFDSAHFLSGYQGKCSNIHGHRWRVVAEVAAENLQSQGQLRGMVTDFGDIKADLKELADNFDHVFIYVCVCCYLFVVRLLFVCYLYLFIIVFFFITFVILTPNY